MSLLLLAALALALGTAAVASMVHRRARSLHSVVTDASLEGDRTAFRRSFAGRGLPDEALDAVHAALATRLAPARLLAPDVRLCTDLGFDAAEIEDVALLVAAELGGHIPTGDELDRFDAAGTTLEGLVRFVAACSALPNRPVGHAGRAA
ncbi:MAG TPA: hypothetical protein VEZ47_08355 [Gemmatirosa sp.]|nr:hypothetical protein [Gemmatirosa sp.]